MTGAKNISLILFVTVASISCWFGGQFFHRLSHYFQLSLEVPASVKNWKIKEEPNGTFHLEITYTFEWKGETVQRTDLFSKKGYPNPYIAKEVLDRQIGRPLTVWLDPNHCQMIALKKPFPTLEGVKTVLSLGILIYFIWLSRFARKRAL